MGGGVGGGGVAGATPLSAEFWFFIFVILDTNFSLSCFSQIYNQLY